MQKLGEERASRKSAIDPVPIPNSPAPFARAQPFRIHSEPRSFNVDLVLAGAYPEPCLFIGNTIWPFDQFDMLPLPPVIGNKKIDGLVCGSEQIMKTIVAARKVGIPVAVAMLKLPGSDLL